MRIAIILGLILCLPLAMSAAEAAIWKVYVAGYSPTIAWYELVPDTGELRELGKVEAGANPSFLAFHPHKPLLFSVNEGASGRVTAFAVAADGGLRRLGDASSGGNGPCHLVVHPGGKWVIAANYGSGHVSVLPITDDALGVGEPVCSELAGRNAHQAVCDPSGRFVFVPCLGSDAIAQFRFDAATGKLTPNQPAQVATVPKAGPRHLAFHPSGKWAYVINESDNSVTSYAFDAKEGTLRALVSVPTLPADAQVKDSSTAEVQIASSGTFLYGSNRGHDSIVSYRIDPHDGALTVIGHDNGGGAVRVPRHFSLTPDGAFALVASQNSDQVIVFRVDAATGAWSKLSTTAVAKGPAFVAAMPRP